MLAEQTLRAIRHQLPALRHGVYLNTGTAGPLPEPAADALQETFAHELAQGRIDPATWKDHQRLREEVRGRLASLLRTTAERIALTHHTTDGLLHAALGLTWRPGDIVVTTDCEHAAVQCVVGMLRVREQATVRLVRLRGVDSRQEAVRRFTQALDHRVRAVFLSHVSYAHGGVMPVEEVAEIAHRVGAWVVVDGAQAVGAIAVDPERIGADLYALSGQKWLCGPEGTGALWVREGREDELRPAAVGFASVQQVADDGYFLPHRGARRMEVGTVFAPGLTGWAASLAWLEAIGWEDVWARTAQLAERARRSLLALDGVEVLTPVEHAGLVSFRLQGRAAEPAVEELRRRGFWVRSIPGWDAVRISCGFFLEEEEIDRFVQAVAALCRQEEA